MKALVFVFPVIFILFAVFFGFTSYSILLKKKPVVLSSKWLIVLMGIGFLPAVVVNLIDFFQSGPESFVQLMISAMFILFFVFYMCVIKGVSIYGITGDDLRKYLFQTLTNKEIAFTEKINKVHLDELNTDINISFQEWMGTGMIKPQDKKKFDFKNFIVEFRKNLNENTVETKKITAYFYFVFAILMVIVSIAFVYIFSRLP